MTLETTIKSLKKAFCIGGALITLASSALGADVYGKITDLNTKNPIQGVKVKFIGATTDSTSTDVNGDYSKLLTDGIYEILVGGKSQYISFDAKSDTLNGTVRRNVAMFDTAATASQIIELWGRQGFVGTKKNNKVFDVADPLNPQIKLDLDSYTAQDSINIAGNKDYFNNVFEREYLKFAPVNDDGIMMHKSASNYTTTSVNSQGIILSSDVYADTTLDTDNHEWGHAIGLYHVSSRESFMNSVSPVPMPNSLDKKIVNAGYDHMDAFKDGRTDFYMAQLSDTTILSGVEGQPEKIVFPFKSMNLSNYPNPAKNNVTISYKLPENTQSKTTLKVYNITGQLVKQEDINSHSGENKYMTSVSGLASGVYIYNVTSGNLSSTGKMNVAR